MAYNTQNPDYIRKFMAYNIGIYDLKRRIMLFYRILYALVNRQGLE